MNHLDQLGCETVNDLKLLNCEKDLITVLRLLETRKLQAKLKELGLCAEDQQISDLQTPSRSHIQQNASTPSSDISVTHADQLPECSRTRQPLEAWAANFEIPWAKFSNSLQEAFEKKLVARKLNVLQCVRLVSNEIAKITTNPGSANLGVIASRMVAKHPASLADRILGSDEPLAGGSTSLFRRFVRQFENRNRANKNSLKRKLLGDSDNEDISDSTNGPSRKRFKSASFSKDQYDCLNWQPVSYPEGEDDETMEEKRLWLASEFKKVGVQRNVAVVDSFMKATFAAQRLYINKNKPPMNDVKDDWPFLLTHNGILNHFDELMGFSLAERADKFFGERGDSIYKYSKTVKCARLKDVRLRLAAASKMLKNSVAKTYGSVLLLPGLLKETADMLFKNYDEAATPGEMEENAGCHPHLAITGGDPFGYDQTCYVLVDGLVVCGPGDFRTSLLVMFASYYIFNVSYPKEAAAILEFLQRAMAQINPDRGSKAGKASKQKYPTPLNGKVLKLLNELKEFDNPWQL